MKLRIRGNSLRLRLAQAEVTALATAGECTDTVQFSPSCALVYRLRSDSEASGMAAQFAHNAITVSVSAARARTWADSSEVTMRGEQANGGDEPLVILVEKDFACLAPRDDEDESDLFPHPEAGSGHGC